MSRDFILAVGGLCWAVVAVNAAVDLMLGEVLLPVVSAIGFVVWAIVFRRHFDAREASA